MPMSSSLWNAVGWEWGTEVSRGGVIGLFVRQFDEVVGDAGEELLAELGQ